MVKEALLILTTETSKVILITNYHWTHLLILIGNYLIIITVVSSESTFNLLITLYCLIMKMLNFIERS